MLPESLHPGQELSCYQWRTWVSSQLYRNTRRARRHHSGTLHLSYLPLDILYHCKQKHYTLLYYISVLLFRTPETAWLQTDSHDVSLEPGWNSTLLFAKSLCQEWTRVHTDGANGHYQSKVNWLIGVFYFVFLIFILFHWSHSCLYIH